MEKCPECKSESVWIKQTSGRRECGNCGHEWQGINKLKKIENNFKNKFTPKVTIESITDRRQMLLNKFLTKSQNITNFVNEFIEFLELEFLSTNEVEKADLKEIAYSLKIGLGGIDQAREDIYAFDHRIKEENLKTIA